MASLPVNCWFLRLSQRTSALQQLPSPLVPSTPVSLQFFDAPYMTHVLPPYRFVTLTHGVPPVHTLNPNSPPASPPPPYGPPATTQVLTIVGQNLGAGNLFLANDRG